MKATTHGERFHVTGSSHLNSDSVFKAAELGNRCHEDQLLSKRKKESLKREMREINGFQVLEKQKLIEELNSKELETLLYWYCVPKTKMGNLENKKQK